MIKNQFRGFRQTALQFMLKVKGESLEVKSVNTLIISPHPDDETFGCAGLIIQKKELGAKVYVLFLTNGEASLNTNPKDEIKNNRINTSQKVCNLLKVDQTIYLNIEDGKIDSSDQNVINELQEIINEYDIEEVYVTHKEEGWSDHSEAALLAFNTCRELNSVSLYYYWVWVWFSVGFKSFKSLNLSNTFYLDVSLHSKLKQKLITIYLENTNENAQAYCGKLPEQFLKAFRKNLEVFEKVR